jgi:hypothetical protein
MCFLSFVRLSKPIDINVKHQYATYSIQFSDLPDDEDTFQIHIQYFDVVTAKHWLEFSSIVQDPCENEEMATRSRNWSDNLQEPLNHFSRNCSLKV